MYDFIVDFDKSLQFTIVIVLPELFVLNMVFKIGSESENVFRPKNENYPSYLPRKTACHLDKARYQLYLRNPFFLRRRILRKENEDNNLSPTSYQGLCQRKWRTSRPNSSRVL